MELGKNRAETLSFTILTCSVVFVEILEQKVPHYNDKLITKMLNFNILWVTYLHSTRASPRHLQNGGEYSENVGA
ncbi:hypothetical protein L2E82_33582 [Cichorium intybus]|uniref:Uncharacterized protein n=1 Tax=Cichorium intybus TaxID=13427 RepID=A0ACB9BKU2_CICIN|nr:hypothetical protein L2E82_33582 [Cichorium intybus]